MYSSSSGSNKPPTDFARPMYVPMFVPMSVPMSVVETHLYVGDILSVYVGRYVRCYSYREFHNRMDGLCMGRLESPCGASQSPDDLEAITRSLLIAYRRSCPEVRYVCYVLANTC